MHRDELEIEIFRFVLQFIIIYVRNTVIHITHFHTLVTLINLLHYIESRIQYNEEFHVAMLKKIKKAERNNEKNSVTNQRIYAFKIYCCSSFLLKTKYFFSFSLFIRRKKSVFASEFNIEIIS